MEDVHVYIADNNNNNNKLFEHVYILFIFGNSSIVNNNNNNNNNNTADIHTNIHTTLQVLYLLRAVISQIR